MSLSGLCQICESNEAEYTCAQCGTPVCKEHYQRDKSLCTRCVERSGRDDIANPDPDSGPGVDGDDVHRI